VHIEHCESQSIRAGWKREGLEALYLLSELMLPMVRIDCSENVVGDIEFLSVYSLLVAEPDPSKIIVSLRGVPQRRRFAQGL